MVTQFKPMLSEHLSPGNSIKFPCLAFPKYDGVRCLTHPTFGPVGRSLKPIRNKFVRAALSLLPACLDGELLLGDPDDPTAFSKTGVFGSKADRPDSKVHFIVFDHFDSPLKAFFHRLEQAKETWKAFAAEDPLTLEITMPGTNQGMEWYVSEHVECNNMDEVQDYYQKCVERGFEGVILRWIWGPYKYGRSTESESYSIKIKATQDAEAEIIGYEPLYRNHNAPKINELGRTQRSTAAAGMVADDTLGKFLVRGINGRFEGVEFSVGSGLNDKIRAKVWANRKSHLGKLITYTYQDYGSVDKPRTPVFKGFRERDDL